MPSMKELVEMSDDVLNEMRPEELALLAEAVIDSDNKSGDVVNKPTAENPLPMTIGELETAGKVYVYNRFTGERSLCLRNLLEAQIRKTNDDGEYIFITYPPKNPDGTLMKPWRGSTLCMLHPDSEDRSAYDRMGLPVCKSGNLASDFQMRLHMQHRHKNEWAQLQDIEQQKVDEEERLVRQALIRANTSTEDLLVPVAAVNEAAPPIEVAAPVIEEEEAVPETFVIETEVEPEPVKVESKRVKVEEILSECLFCEKPMKGRTVKQKNRNTRLHMSSAHPEMEVTV